jgi:hypothetical protein
MSKITTRIRRNGRRPPRERILMMAGITITTLAPKLLGPWAAAIIPAALGLAFVASSARGHPLLAKLAARRAVSRPALAARLRQPRVTRALATMSVIWGGALLAEAAALLTLSVTLQASQLGPISSALTFGLPGTLAVATFAYVRHDQILARFSPQYAAPE